MFDLKMQEYTRAEERRKNFPQYVENLPLTDEAKKYILSAGFIEGTKVAKVLLAQKFKPQTKTLTKKDARNLEVPFGTQQEPGGKLIYPPDYIANPDVQKAFTGALDPKLESYRDTFSVDNKGKVSSYLPDAVITKLMEGTNVDPVAGMYKQFSLQNQENWSKITDFSQLKPFIGEKATKFNQLEFVINNFPKDHKLFQRANSLVLSEKIKISQNGAVSIPLGVDANGDRKDIQEPFFLKVPKNEKGLNAILQQYRERGIETNPSVIMALNPSFFPTNNVNKMLSSGDLGGKKLIVPRTNAQLTESQVQSIQEEGKLSGQYTIPGFATIIPPQLGSVNKEIELNQSRFGKVDMLNSIDEYMYLLKQPDSVNLMEVGENRGRLEGILWRVIAGIQKGRDFGVLSPSEITTIQKSAPTPNTLTRIMLREIGSDKFINGVMKTLREETENQIRQDDAVLKNIRARKYEYEPVNWMDKYDLSESELEAQSKKRMNYRGLGD